MRQAMTRHDPDWLVLMDDDGRPQPGALAAFQAADLAGWDAVAAAVYYPDGAICEMNRPSRNPFWNLRGFFTTLLRLGRRDSFHIRPEVYAGAVPVAVDITSFVGFFVSRQMVERVGFPDGALFVYGDDGLYSLGLRLAGGRIGFFPQIRFEHDCSTFAQSAGRFRPLWKAYYYHRNLFLLYRRAPGGFFWLVLLLALPKWLFKVRHHPGERRAYLRLLGKAVSDGFRGRAPTLLGMPAGRCASLLRGPHPGRRCAGRPPRPVAERCHRRGGAGCSQGRRRARAGCARFVARRRLLRRRPDRIPQMERRCPPMVIRRLRHAAITSGTRNPPDASLDVRRPRERVQTDPARLCLSVTLRTGRSRSDCWQACR